MLAFLRPDEWDLPLFVHVFGAMVLFGGVATVVLFTAVAGRNPESGPLMRRTAFVTLLVAVWPAFVLMRAGAQWIYDKEDAADDTTWMILGILVGDGGALVLLVLTVLGWLAVRRKPHLFRYLGGLAALYLVALAVAWWAMSTKPGA